MSFAVAVAANVHALHLIPQKVDCLPACTFLPPYTLSDFVPVNLKQGSSVELECQLSGVKDENYVKWLKDGTEVAYETGINSTQKTRYDVDTEDYKLTIAEVSSDDNGIYDCAMLNERREFVIKSKRRYKLSVQGWCNSFNSRYHVLPF